MTLPSRGAHAAGVAILNVALVVLGALAVLAPLVFAGPGIAIDSAPASTSSANTSALTWSHTVTSTGSDLYLVVGAAYDNTGVSASGVKFGTQTMTLLGQQGIASGCAMGLWGLVNPPTGTSTVTVTMSASTAVTGSSISLTGVHQTTSTGTFGSTFAISATPLKAVTSATTEVVIDTVCAKGSPTATVGGGQTQRWNGIDSSNTTRGACSNNKAGATSVTMSWTLSASGRWAIGAIPIKPSNLSEVKLDSFTAFRSGNQVEIRWQTGLEVNNLGYRVYQGKERERVRITPEIIAGSALLAGQNVPLAAGRSYRWRQLEQGTERASSYWLEEIDLGGKSTWYGPISPNGVPVEGIGSHVSPLLAEQGTRPAVNAGRFAPASPGFRARATAAADGPNPKRIKVRVKADGWYRISQDELFAAGLDPQVGLQTLRLSKGGQEYPLRVNDAGSIEFYGTGRDTPWGDASVYWLAAGEPGGRRVTTAAATSGPATSERYFSEVVESRPRTLYFAALGNGEKENFFGPTIGTNGLDIKLQIDAIDASAPAELELEAQGVTDQPHRIHIELGGREVGELAIDGRHAGKTRLPIQMGASEGENVVQLHALGGELDVSLLDSVRLYYGRRYQAANGSLRFTTPGEQEVTITGFDGAAVRVFDVTDPLSVEELSPRVVESGGGAYAVSVTPPAAGIRTLLALGETRIRAPLGIEGVPERSSWAGRHPGADLLIISHRTFLPGLAPLLQLRRAEGWQVAVADVDEVYDDFSFGEKTPYAIRDLIEASRTNWERRPRFVLLVGDATYDPRNYLGLGDFDFVPTKLVDTEFLETSSDDWFVTRPGAASADLGIGRLPVRTPEQIDTVVSKIVSFGRGEGRARDMVLYTDAKGSSDFDTPARELMKSLPPDVVVHRLSRTEGGSEIKTRLLEALNGGPLVVDYLGHGSQALWAGQALSSADVSALTNVARPSLFALMTCLNNFFQDQQMDALGETLLLAKNGGALAAWGSSALTQPSDQMGMNSEFFRGILSDSTTLGEAVVRAKAEAGDSDVGRTWILLGDPTMRLPGAAGPAPDRPAEAKSAGCVCTTGHSCDGQGLVASLVLAGFFCRLRRRAKP